MRGIRPGGHGRIGPDVASRAARSTTAILALALLGVGVTACGWPAAGTYRLSAPPVAGVRPGAAGARGVLYAWGNGFVPTRCFETPDVVKVAGGANHIVVLRSDGNVFESDTRSGRAGPTVRIDGLHSISDVAAYHSCSLAISNGGRVWSWDSESRMPVDVRVDGVVAIGPGTLRDAEGGIRHLWARARRLALGLTALAGGGGAFVGIRGDGTGFIGIRGDGRAIHWGTDPLRMLPLQKLYVQRAPRVVVGIADVVAVAAGYHFYIAADKSGNCYSWGWNGSWQLGLGDTRDRARPTRIPGLDSVVALAAGSYHGLALTADNDIWEWGIYDAQEQIVSRTPRRIRCNKRVLQLAATRTISVALVEASAAGSGDDVVFSLEP